MIEETVTREVASAEVTDDCLVELWLRKPRLRLVSDQARGLARELYHAAWEADRASVELLHPVKPARFDMVPETLKSPDCRDGKHQACVGDAWSPAEDAQTLCECSCHWDTIAEERAA